MPYYYIQWEDQGYFDEIELYMTNLNCNPIDKFEMQNFEFEL